jgi:hypothetical protein
MNQISSEVVFVELIQVEIPQFVVADSVGKHVVDGHQDLVSYRDSMPLAMAAALAASTSAVFK